MSVHPHWWYWHWALLIGWYKNMTKLKIPVGISSCLLGDNVRFDGGHKRDAYIVGTLSHYF
ncbi:MAG: hypothetical protein CG439_1659, partial [Methylococcaceae bacterium NSP1-2]